MSSDLVVTPTEGNVSFLAEVPRPSRFEAARQNAAELGTLAECSMALEAAGRQLERAKRLVDTAQGVTPINRPPTVAEAAVALHAALAEMQGVLEEIGV